MPARTPQTILIGLALLLGLLAGPAQAQVEKPDFSAEPAQGSSVARGGGWFELDAQPGDRLTQSLTLRNRSARPLTLHVAATDATTASLGGVSYALPEQPRERVAAWVTLDREEVQLDSGETTDVTFSLDVPSDAAQRVHMAGIAVWVPADTTDTAAAAAGQAGAAIDIQTRRVIALQVNLPGPVAPLLRVTGIDAVARPDGLYLEIGVENEGTGMTTATGKITVSDGSLTRDFAIDTFIPGTEIAYPVKWAEAAGNGDYEVDVVLAYGVHRTSWEGSFTIGSSVQDALRDRAVIGTAGDLPTGLIAGGLMLMLMLMLMLLLVVAFAVVRRRRVPSRAPYGPGFRS